MTDYRITSTDDGVAIQITGIDGRQQELLDAFGECQQGHCSCPPDEYRKVEAIQVVPSDDAIAICLQATPGTQFDSSEIAACLDYTVQQGHHLSHWCAPADRWWADPSASSASSSVFRSSWDAMPSATRGDADSEL